MLAYLQSKKILDEEDIQSINKDELNVAKCKTLLDILVTRKNSFDILKDALSHSNQNGALDILELYISDIRHIGDISYHTKKILGTGGCGTKVYNRKYGKRDAAVKIISCDTDESIQKALRELDYLMKLNNHPHLIQYYNGATSQYQVFIALELCLFDLAVEITERKQSLPQLEMLAQMAKAVTYLHLNRIIHRDLKPSNVLISVHKQVKITDFGISKQLQTDQSGISVTNAEGTEEWLAPEILVNNEKTTTERLHMDVRKPSDVFLLGCVFFYVLSSGNHPFGNGRIKRLQNILIGKSQIHGFSIEEEWLDLIQRMISHESTGRPTAQLILDEVLHLLKYETHSSKQDKLGQQTSTSANRPQDTELRSIKAGNSRPLQIVIVNYNTVDRNAEQSRKRRRLSSIQNRHDEPAPKKNTMYIQKESSGSNENDVTTVCDSQEESNSQATSCEVLLPQNVFDKGKRKTHIQRNNQENVRPDTHSSYQIGVVSKPPEGFLTTCINNFTIHENSLKMNNKEFLAYVLLVCHSGMLDLLAQTNHDGYTALHLRLISRGVDIDETIIRTYIVSSPNVHHIADNDGNNLLAAAIIGRKKLFVLKIIVEFGVGLSSNNISGQTALHLAVLARSISYVNFCLNHDSSLTEKDDEDSTPLMLAEGLLNSAILHTSKRKMKRSNLRSLTQIVKTLKFKENKNNV